MLCFGRKTRKQIESKIIGTERMKNGHNNAYEKFLTAKTDSGIKKP